MWLLKDLALLDLGSLHGVVGVWFFGWGLFFICFILCWAVGCPARSAVHYWAHQTLNYNDFNLAI